MRLASFVSFPPSLLSYDPFLLYRRKVEREGKATCKAKCISKRSVDVI